MTTYYHLTKNNYDALTPGLIVPHNPAYDRAITVGSTWRKTFGFSGDLTEHSTWSSVINNRWAHNDTDGVLVTATCTTNYDAEANKTFVWVVFNGNDLDEIQPTINLINPRDRKTAQEGINYYTWELREAPDNNEPIIWFTGFVEVYPRAGVTQ
jgi:hypothetical protein